MGKSQKKLCGFIFLALVAVGLVLAIVGLCTDVVTYKAVEKGVGLFADDWELVKEVASPTFTIIAFFVTLAGAVVLVVDAILRLFVGKDLKIVRIVGVAVTFIGAILILVAGLVLVGNMNNPIEGVNLDMYATGVGVWLGFIGGLVAAIAGALPLLKAFN